MTVKNTETKTRQFVNLLKDSEGVTVKAGAGAAPQPRGALWHEQSAP